MPVPSLRLLLFVSCLAFAIACDSESGSPSPDAGADSGAAASTGCSGAGSCADLDEGACMASGLVGLGCAAQRADVCLFGGGLGGPPSDPGCAGNGTQQACSVFSTGCRWTGSACAFKACHTLTDAGTCGTSGCFWNGTSCYYANCPTLQAGPCQSTFACDWWDDRYVGCTGSYTCSDATGVFGATDEQVCRGLADEGVGCTWTP